MPLVLRVSIGTKYGAQHSQDWSFCSARPGTESRVPRHPLRCQGHAPPRSTVATRSCSSRASGLRHRGTVLPGGVPGEPYEVPTADLSCASGSDLTIITVGATLYRALEAADQLAQRYQLTADVIDLRFLNPLNYETLVESVKKTGRVVLASDACERGSFLNDVATNLTQLAFDDLDAPPAVMSARNWITPPAEMESAFYPQAEWIIDTIHERLLPLPGHRVTTDRSLGELARRARQGV